MASMNRVAGDYYPRHVLADAVSTANPTRMSSPTKVARSPSARVENNVETSFRLANLQLRSPVAATPPSIDKVTPAAPGASYASSSIAEVMEQIKDSKALDSGFLELPVSLEVCHELSDSAIIEDLGAKLNYSADTGILVVTWSTALHESFKWTTRPFSELAHAYPDQFVADTNIDIPSNGTSITTTPDFAFGKIGSDSSTVYFIILESAYAQGSEKLADKVEKHLARPEVACVIGLDFTMSRLDGPTGRPRVGQDAMTQSEFITAANAAGLGPVEMGGITWAPAIEKIELTMWRKISGTDITPINNISEDPGLVERHNEILKRLRTVTRAVIEKSKFDLIYPDKKSFRIDWQGFYGDLLRCLRYDAFRRYTGWFHKNDPKPGVSGSRKRTDDDLYPDSDPDDDKAEDTDSNPKFKKFKKDQRYRPSLRSGIQGHSGLPWKLNSKYELYRVCRENASADNRIGGTNVRNKARKSMLGDVDLKAAKWVLA
ncbi:hypothetical protein B0H19DRAFT_1083376 [Mycena capillaripes]|nr:hypothetical protein B0H19DRAFT_1083376 [Mycena capillaripes]